MRKRVASVLSLIAVFTAGLVATTASPAAAIEYRGVFTFNKGTFSNKINSNSTLTWDVYRLDRDPPLKVVSKTWKAGSGMNSNDCDKSTSSSPEGGWLPNGTYGFAQYDNWNGSLIKGIVFQLDSKACRDGSVTRTELFIHTESPWSSPGGYRSLGCIKMSPTHIKEARDAFRAYFPAGKRDPAHWVLQVIS